MRQGIYVRTILGNFNLLQLTWLEKHDLKIESISAMNIQQKSTVAKDLFIKTQEENFKAIRATLREIFQKQALSKNEILTELSHLITNYLCPEQCVHYI